MKRFTYKLWTLQLAVTLLVFYHCKAQSVDTIKIVCFGNSTTAPRKNIKKIYPVRLRDTLQKINIPVVVLNAGLGGSHTGSIKDNNFHKIAHGKDRFDSAVLNQKPDWVIIAFGINDAWQDKGQDSSSRIPLKQYINNLTFFIDKIQELGGRVILMSPNPIGIKYEHWRLKQLSVYAKATQRLARKKKTAFVNTWKLFNKAVKENTNGVDALLLDGLHPNDMGHEIMSNAILTILLSKNNLSKIKK